VTEQKFISCFPNEQMITRSFLCIHGHRKIQIQVKFLFCLEELERIHHGFTNLSFDLIN